MNTAKKNGFAAENPQFRTERTWWSASSKAVGMLGSTVFSMSQHYELSDYGQSERGSSKDLLHRFPSILAAPRASPAESTVSDATVSPHRIPHLQPGPIFFLMQSLRVRAKSQEGPLPFFKAKASLSFRSLKPLCLRPPTNKISVTDPKRVKITTIFSSKVSSRVGKRNFCNAPAQRVKRGLVFPGNFSTAGVNNL
ncbi:hypothetical protein AVEN_229589-1 [Araneus ventricosus]|uniref:Uncharacterized protein n=1 Tax=Araneus ventricosus TaxID=182803 RepID=A0A4Y2DC61_ARAVE|nr:hypothetical protein AVEN_229589-1 [Araneus ventricosus]